MAEGEFALVRQHLEASKSKPLSYRSLGLNDHDLYAMLVDAAVQQRDMSALREYVPLAEALAERHGHTLYRAIAQRAWGVLHYLAGDNDQALVSLNAALDIFRALDTQWQLGRTHVELGELARACGDVDAARRHLTEALAAFESLGGLPDVRRTRAAQQALD